MASKMHKLMTKLGDIYVGANNNSSVYFNSHRGSSPNNFVVNGVEYRVEGHMQKTPDGWKITEGFSCHKVNTVKWNDFTHSAWNKAHTEIANVIREWLTYPMTILDLQEAQTEYDKDRRDIMLGRIATAQKELDALKAELATMP
jgi:hypothetical protein